MTPDHVNIRIPLDLRDRIDAARPSTVSREAWVRSACESALTRGVVDSTPNPPPPTDARADDFRRATKRTKR